MTDLKSTIFAAQPRTVKPSGNLVAAVRSVDVAAGTLAITILTGPAAGQELNFKPRGDIAIEGYTKGNTKLAIPADANAPIGEFPTIRIENIQQKDGDWTCQWCKTLMKNQKPSDYDWSAEYDVSMQLDRLPNGSARLRVLDVKEQVLAKDFDTFTTAMESMLEKTGAVDIFAASGDGDFFTKKIYRRAEYKDGNRNFTETSKERVAAEVAIMQGEDAVRESFAKGAEISLVPVRGIFLGKTVTEIAAGHHAGTPAVGANGKQIQPQVDFKAFDPRSIGNRVAAALAFTGQNAISAEAAEDLKARFLAKAGDAEKAAFAVKGWRGVSDEALSQFFASEGANVPVRKNAQTVLGTLVAQKFARDKEDVFIAKTFATGPAYPFPPVEALKDLRKSYVTEVSEAIRAVTKGVAVTADVDNGDPVDPGKEKVEAALENANAVSDALDGDLSDIMAELENEADGAGVGEPA